MESSDTSAVNDRLQRYAGRSILCRVKLVCSFKTLENIVQSDREVVGQGDRHVILDDPVVPQNFQRSLHRSDRRLVLLDKVIGGPFVPVEDSAEPAFRVAVSPLEPASQLGDPLDGPPLIGDVSFLLLDVFVDRLLD